MFLISAEFLVKWKSFDLDGEVSHLDGLVLEHLNVFLLWALKHNDEKDEGEGNQEVDEDYNPSQTVLRNLCLSEGVHSQAGDTLGNNEDAGFMFLLGIVVKVVFLLAWILEFDGGVV